MAVSSKKGVAEPRLVKAVIFCRQHKAKVTLILPCNWVRSGLCGVDCRPCDLTVLERVL